MTARGGSGPQVLCHCRKCQTLTGSHYAHDIGFAPEHVRPAAAPPFLLLYRHLGLLRNTCGSYRVREACIMTALILRRRRAEMDLAWHLLPCRMSLHLMHASPYARAFRLCPCLLCPGADCYAKTDRPLRM